MMDRQMASTQTLRIAELHSHDIFCTPLEARFDRLTRLARASLRVPVVAITVCGGQRLWFKSVIGWDVRELPVSESLSERTLASTEPVIVEDTRLDSALARHPLVVNHPKFRFYAGQCLADDGGRPVGTFDIFDLRPRVLEATDLQTLHDLVQLARKELLTTDLRDAQIQLVQKLDLARREALMDPLTATWNRRAANDLLQQAIESADRDDDAVAVCMVDIDKFKQINDTHGHPAGDMALRKVARILVRGVRDGDAVCRIGGDEFLIVMARAGASEADEISARLRKSLGQTPLRIRDASISVSITTGTAVRKPGANISPKDLIQIADRELYQAKQGRSAATTVERSR